MDIRHLFRQTERRKVREDAEGGTAAMNTILTPKPHRGVIVRIQRVLVILFLLGIIGSAQATIPLILQRTIQLPPGDGWDVQHVMGDNSFGWARMQGDTLLYKYSEGDSLHHRTIPRRLTGPDVDSYEHVAVRLIRIVPADSHLCALIYSRAMLYDYGDVDIENILYFMDLDTGTGLHTLFSDGGGSTEWHDGTTIISLFYPWPALPAVSTNLYYCTAVNIRYWVMPGYWTDNYGTAASIDFENAWQFTSLGYWENLQPYYRSASPMFAISRQSTTTNDMTGEWIDFSCRMGTFAESNHVIRDTTHSCGWVVAQEDFDGTRRIIEQHAAYDPVTFTQLWQNPEIPWGNMYTARLSGIPDERLLIDNSRTFLIYNAANGSYIDRTSVYNGTLQGLIKHADRAAEIVTFDSNASLVRIYTTAPPSARHLTIQYIPETQHIRLQWQQAEGAIGHKVYSTDRPSGGDLNLIAELPADSLSYNVLPVAEKRFFFVTDEFEAR
jgi:hypothetical protein